ncbi:MAG TPA: fused MFS/spermidine synthase, partial [Gemmataceae bacterium]|nr:fused MFS/spermidine synthase [Gemmataceae bacterium]
MTHVVSPRLVPPALLVGLGAVVFLANAGLLVLQLLAGRFLAPFIGSSVETWTCVIGVFLTGIALGNHYGGRLADRKPATRTLGWLLVLGGLGALSMILWWEVFNNTSLDQVLPLTPRIPILAAVFCLVPAFVLSLMTPLTIKLMLPDVTRAGRVAGLVFALSTLGCLVGNYVTGFWLMANFTLNAIAIGVAVGLLLLAAPMFLVDFRLSAVVGAAAQTTKPTAVDDPLGFSKDIRRAFAVVFIASFCGMSLELTASRVLAPVLGVSLYSWTGIIGVMLAGTACGNYLGGVLADRGSGAAMRRLAILMGLLIGFAGAPAFVRSLVSDNLPEPVAATEDELQQERDEGELTKKARDAREARIQRERDERELMKWPQGVRDVWICRFVGAGIGVAVAIGTIIVGSRGRRGQIAWLAVLGAVLGYTVAHPIIRSFGSVLHIQNLAYSFSSSKESLGFEVGSLVVHLIVAIVGALIAVGIGYDSENDKKTSSRTTRLAISLFTAALFVGMVVLLNGMFQNDQLPLYKKLTGYDLVSNVFAWTFMLFFVPMLCLGMISPQVIRLSIPDTGHTGRTAGTIYAWSTAGAIVGTFVTGYFLIGLLGMSRVLFFLALVLLGLTFVIGRLWRNTPLLFAGSIVFGIAAVGMFITGYPNRGYTLESKYYAIKVRDSEFDRDGLKIPAKTLSLDLLIHSFVVPDDPNFLGYQHEEVQGELVRHALSKGPTDILVIGGGGYTFPRWCEHNVPAVGIDVVEIDPGVTEVAHSELGLSRQTRIRSFHMDGRQFVREQAKKEHYRLVIQDAVNDLSVPYHLMTKEYNDAVKKTLTKDGAYLLTLIDSIQDGELWRAAVHTMRK